ncbi:MAG: diguanylate cyclase domain-containing protein, partial [Dehalococcoidia bacterium]
MRGPRGAVVGLAIFSRDITEMKRSEDALRESRETVKALLNAPTDAALLIDPSGTILALNQNAADRLSRHARRKLPLEKLVGRCVYDLFPADLADTRRARNDEVVASGTPARFEDARNGRWYDNSTYPVLGPTGDVISLAIFTRDITDQKIAEQMMKKLAYQDSLTGLPNRTAFQIRFAASLADARRRKTGLAVMAFDLDKFKSVNDKLGHAAGDALLKKFGARLLAQIRDGDTAARIGGDEFVLVLPGITTEKHAGEVAQRIIAAVKKPTTIEGHTVR